MLIVNGKEIIEKEKIKGKKISETNLKTTKNKRKTGGGKKNESKNNKWYYKWATNA